MMDYTNVNLSPFEDDKEFIYNDNKFYSSNFNLNWFEELNIEPKVILDIGAYDFGDSIKYKIAFPNSQVYSFEADLERYEKTHKFAEICGVKTFNKAYADDLTLITTNSNDMQTAVNETNIWLKWSQTMKAKPTKCVALGFKLFDKRMKNVKLTLLHQHCVCSI
jgi:hypothetical protein